MSDTDIIDRNDPRTNPFSDGCAVLEQSPAHLGVIGEAPLPGACARPWTAALVKTTRTDK
jgi:hypothetical protein